MELLSPGKIHGDVFYPGVFSILFKKLYFILSRCIVVTVTEDFSLNYCAFKRDKSCTGSRWALPCVLS